MEQAKEVIVAGQGFRSLKLLRGIEQPSTYLLLIEWDSVEDHMQGFRESDLFVRWRELIGSYFAAPPGGGALRGAGRHAVTSRIHKGIRMNTRYLKAPNPPTTEATEELRGRVSEILRDIETRRAGRGAPLLAGVRQLGSRPTSSSPTPSSSARPRRSMTPSRSTSPSPRTRSARSPTAQRGTVAASSRSRLATASCSATD